MIDTYIFYYCRKNTVYYKSKYFWIHNTLIVLQIVNVFLLINSNTNNPDEVGVI